MKLIGKIVATWLIGFALVLLVMDGVRTMGDRRVSIMPLGDTWELFATGGRSAALEGLAGLPAGQLWVTIAEVLLLLPGWVVFGAVGTAIALLSSSQRERRFSRIEHM